MHSRLSNRQFLIVGAIIVGLWAGLTAVILKISVHYFQVAIKSAGQTYHWIYFVAPTVGILATYLFVRFVLKGDLSKGTSHVLLAIARKSSSLPTKETYSHVVTSALTVGMGGSAGLESPIVQTGSAIGSVFASLFPVSFKDRTLLLACGAAAGIATAFNAPIAGVLFALEVLLMDVTISAFIPLLIAGATGALCSNILLSNEIIFSFKNVSDFNYRNVPYYVLLGCFTGLVSAFYIKAFLKTEALMKGVLVQPLVRLFIGGVLLGGLIYLFPALFGEGYSSVRALSAFEPSKLFSGSPLLPYLANEKWMLGMAVLGVGILKVFAVSLTLNSGGNGGSFAPSLLVGACIGFAFAFMFNLTGLTKLPIINFCLVAMAGTLTGIFHAPLTAIFLIAEITGGYDLIIPLMIVSAISTGVSRYFNSDSLDGAKLKESSHTVEFNKDSHVLSELSLSGFIERNFTAVPTDATLKTVVDAVARSKRNIFPMVDQEGMLTGIIVLEDIREIMFDVTQYDTVTVSQIAEIPSVTVEVNEDMASIMEKFDKSGLWNIPVVDEGKYIGFISKSSILSNYRNKLRVDY
ncbi:chloride channel protein [soil metagenome]